MSHISDAASARHAAALKVFREVLGAHVRQEQDLTDPAYEVQRWIGDYCGLNGEATDSTKSTQERIDMILEELVRPVIERPHGTDFTPGDKLAQIVHLSGVACILLQVNPMPTKTLGELRSRLSKALGYCG